MRAQTRSISSTSIRSTRSRSNAWAKRRPTGIRACLPDDAFAHDGQITKQGIRAVTIAALAPRDGELLVGYRCWLRFHSDRMACVPRVKRRAVAIEAREDRAARIAENAARHGVSLAVVQGEAPAALVDLPSPDAVFIGGGASNSVVVDDGQLQR